MKRIAATRLNGYEKLLNYGLTTLTFPFTMINFNRVPVNSKHVVTIFGKYQRTVNSGLYWGSFFTENKPVYVGYRTSLLKKSKITDIEGVPINVNAVINYKVTHPENFVINVNNDANFVTNQAEATLRKTLSRYTYFDEQNESIVNNNDSIMINLKENLQHRVNIAGVQIEDFSLTDISYTEEIAQDMLIMQVAKANLRAKKYISEGSAEIIKDIISNLGTANEVEKSKLIRALLITLISGNRVQPIIKTE